MKYSGRDEAQELFDFQCLNLQACSLSYTVLRGVNIASVNISNNRITQLPANLILQLPLLQSFKANGNYLNFLPEEFGELSHLQELFLCENNLVSLPESLAKLIKLQVLKLNTNRLKRLYAEIGQNISLEILSVNENKLKRFPATLGLLINLHALEANCNKLETLPSTLNYLENLTKVDLSRNRLTVIPESFGDLKRLTYIDFSKNRIENLCKNFQSTKSLNQLFLDHNVFTRCPEWFKDLEGIVEITMTCNKLSGLVLHEDFGLKSKQLKHLDLRGNFIQDLPSSFGHLNSLESLLLGTPLRPLERSSYFLNGNWLKTFPLNFAQLISLTVLHVQENQLRDLPRDIGGLVHLEDLFLGSNLLIELPSSFTKLVSLKRCQLSRNLLVKLPEDIGMLGSLTEFYLDYNKLKVLPTSIRNLTNLKLLDLSGNKLKQSPANIIPPLVRFTPFYHNDIPEEINSPKPCADSCILDTNKDYLEVDVNEGIDKLNLSLSSTEMSSSHTDVEDNWDDNKHISDRYDFEGGQFDCDDEEPMKQIFTVEQSRFNSQYRSSFSVIQTDIQSHNLKPYNYHFPTVSPFFYEPFSEVEGQFDGDSVVGDIDST